MKRLRSLGLALAISAAVLLGTAYLGHRRFRARLAAPGAPPASTIARDSGLPVEVAGSIASFNLDPARRDLHTLTKSRRKRLRIFALGDSFTFGGEVPAGLDYPARLQRRLAEAGISDVEVVNLGNTWHGLGQSYRLWETVLRDYDCDFILLGPEGFFFDRDETFNHGEPDFPDYQHGRYILDGPGLRFLDVLGKESSEGRMANYYRFPPPLRYLRFDRHSAPFLRGLLAADRTVANPFYYSSLDEDTEGLELYRRIFECLTRDRAHLVLLAHNARIPALVSSLRGVTAGALTQIWGSLYRRPGNHYSGLGNDLVAQAFCHALAPRSCPRPRYLALERGSFPVAELAPRLELVIAGQPVSALIYLTDRYRDDDAAVEPVTGARFLLFLPDLDGYVLPLDFVPRPGAPLLLRSAAGERVIGSVESSGALGFLSSAVLRSRQLPPMAIEAQAIAPSEIGAELQLDGRPLGRLERRQGRVLLVPGSIRLAYFRPLAGMFVDLATLPETGELKLRAGAREQVIGRYRQQDLGFTVETRARQGLPAAVAP